MVKTRWKRKVSKLGVKNNKLIDSANTIKMYYRLRIDTYYKNAERLISLLMRKYYLFKKITMQTKNTLWSIIKI